MKKLYNLLLATLCMLTACNDDSIIDIPLTAEQQELIGTAVQFEPFVPSFKTSTRVASVTNHEGGFNSNDMMYIYRQYYENGNWVYKNPPGTIYKYTDLTNGETGLFDRTSWRVYEGKTFIFEDNEYTNVENDTHRYEKKLTKADSIIWESGVTVRFRAWALSRIGNDLADASGKPGVAKSINYPDYMVCDWVTVSGPTEKIPMAMRHLGSRLGFAPREDNQFVKIEIATDAADYMRDDNAETNQEDKDDKHPETSDDGTVLTAAQCAAKVKDVFDRMCWPAGIDMESLSLLACENGNDQNTYKIGTQTEDYIRTNVRRAEFRSSADSYWYMVTIPYDMSSNHKNEPLILPPYTRFKIWLRDVNNGDAGTSENAGVGSSENRYHIFSLKDVLKAGTNETAFKDGMTLLPGYSYRFTVGYKYNSIQVYAEDNFSWADQEELSSSEATDNTVSPLNNAQYTWWRKAVEEAGETAKNSSGAGYHPSFTIKDATELQEFVKLVNGDFTYEPEIYKEEVINKDEQGNVISREIKWYTGTIENGDGTIDKVWVDKKDLEEQGYIFYKKYTFSIADREAKLEEDYLKQPYSFYDDDFQVRMTIKLTADIDLEDVKLSSIGSADKPFSGYFDGDGHTISNLYIEKGKPLFGYAEDGNISNLTISSTHPTSLAGTIKNERILGCSVLAPSKQATFANETNGFCYFVGCIHVGSSNDVPLVNGSKDMGFKMYGCMQAASGITNAALANVSTTEEFIFPMRDWMGVDSVGWTSVACNYYDTELSVSAKAFSMPGGYYLPSANVKDDDEIIYRTFHRLQYIRGVPSHIMCAKNDYLVDSKTEWFGDKMNDITRKEVYGAAPWRAMNYGIYMYNETAASIDKCQMHYESTSDIGYSHRYPQLKKNAPLATQYINVLEQFN